MTTSLILSSRAQKAFTEDAEDDANAKLTMNRANVNQVKLDEVENAVVKSKTVPLLQRFSATSITADWTQRADLTLGFDSADKLVSVEVANKETGEGIDLEQTFKKMCEEGAFYQLNIPDYGLISSQQACQYSQQGLNETLTFFTNSQGGLVSFAYEVS